MKVNVEIECTPEEARRFLGLPDLRPMQDAVMAKVQQQMLDAVNVLSPESLLKTWMPLVPRRISMRSLLSSGIDVSALIGRPSRR